MRRAWLDWECEFLRRHYADNLTQMLADVLQRPLRRVLAKANAMGLHKSPAVIAETARQRVLENPDHGSRRSRFQKGLVPSNKGLRMPGVKPGRMAETQFKPGHRPRTWVPVGSYRVTADGYLEQKINDLPGNNSVRWKGVHRLVWEAAHGPAPAGSVIVFRPGRHTTVLELITDDALELVTRAQLMARNTVHNLPAPLKDVTMVRAQLTRAINRKAKEAEPA